MHQQQSNGKEFRPRILSLHVKNYRVLQDLELSALTPLTVFIGPNASGKSTLLDVFDFLAESFGMGVRSALNRRGQFQELHTRGMGGPIAVEITYKEHADSPRTFTYSLEVNEDEHGPYIASEKFWIDNQGPILEFHRGEGRILDLSKPGAITEEDFQQLFSDDIPAAGVYGQIVSYPHLSNLRRLVTEWRFFVLSFENQRYIGFNAFNNRPEERLATTGYNLPNVILHLQEKHPAILQRLLQRLSHYVPQLQAVKTERTADGQLQLFFKDAPFEHPIVSRFASEGTLKLLAYLVVLHDPHLPPLIGLEEPENNLHPRLLTYVAEECRKAATKSQILVTTHSPYFVNGLRPEELWILYRNEQGFTRARRAADIPRIEAFMENGALLGDLWTELYFGVGDPLNLTNR